MICNFLNCKDICDLIIKEEKVTMEQINVKNRQREIVFVRQLIMTFCSEKTKSSLASVGLIFGKDHATVHHAKKTIHNLCDTDKVVRTKYEFYKTQIELLEKQLANEALPLKERILIKLKNREALSPREIAEYAYICRDEDLITREIRRLVTHEKYLKKSSVIPKESAIIPLLPQ